MSYKLLLEFFKSNLLSKDCSESSISSLHTHVPEICVLTNRQGGEGASELMEYGRFLFLRASVHTMTIEYLN